MYGPRSITVSSSIPSVCPLFTVNHTILNAERMLIIENRDCSPLKAHNL
jgi:hypothetical protein